MNRNESPIGRQPDAHSEHGDNRIPLMVVVRADLQAGYQAPANAYAATNGGGAAGVADVGVRDEDLEPRAGVTRCARQRQ